ncbi:hypothetical protein ATJ97_2456 [Georgenia soli]|uniref:Uncharacterized protein n=2 Tax=Georgenia soli TaxID=638953 RepID=A0A2A9EMV2_9MICO|nr:hypothetical protein ATJ97_2456 [Georgenia soli]
MLRSMAELEEPTARDRWVVARKRRFYLVAALLFVVGVAAVAWSVLSGNGVGVLIFVILLVPAVMLVLVAFMTERYVNDLDTGREGAATRRTYTLSLMSSLAMAVASVISLAGNGSGGRYAPIWWVILVVSGTLGTIAIVQLFVRRPGARRRRDREEEA